MTTFPTFNANQFRAELQARGHSPNRSGKFLCPFHAERTPSFNITEHDVKGHGRCFGCGWHGDVVDAIKALDNISTREALDRLGVEAVRPPSNAPKPESSPARGMRQPEKGPQNAAMRPVFQWIVDNLPLDDHAARYLADHALDMGEARHHGLRAVTFSDSWKFLDRLRAAFPDELLTASGVMSKDRNGRHYFTLAGRLIVPWYDREGGITFLQGRRLGDSGSKWLSCGPVPTGLFIPGGQYPDRLHSETLWITEGAVDALALHVRRGIRAAGCYNATTANLEPLALQMVAAHKEGRLPGIVLAGDNDSAGQDLARRWVAALTTAGFPQERIEAWREPGVKDIAEFLALPDPRELTTRLWREIERTDPVARDQVNKILAFFPNARIERISAPGAA